MFDVFYFGEKPNKFPHERRIENIEQAYRLNHTRFFWIIDYLCDYSGFDFLWIPPPWQQHQRHAWSSQWQQDCGTYLVPCLGYADTNYHKDKIIQRLPSTDNWQIPDYIDFDSVDLSWHPSPLDPPANYHFSVCWGWDRVGGPIYRMPGATDWVYLDIMDVRTRPDPKRWSIPDWIDAASVDLSWHPNPTEPPYIYEFPVEWGWNNIGGPQYHVPGAIEKKYDNTFLARTKPDPDNFQINALIDPDSDVLRWRPNPADPPYIYVFGNQWWPAEKMSTVEYHVAGAKEHKYLSEPIARLAPTQGDHWNPLVDCEWDRSWCPDPGDPPYIYVFGNQWWPAEVMPTVEYHVAGATERKFMSGPRAKLLPTDRYWNTITDHPIEFDSSWCPDPGDPAYIYVFGNQWWPAEIMPTVEYHTPGATERKFVEYPRVTILPNRANWQVPEEVDDTNIDFSWIPDPGDPLYVYHFASDYQQSVGLTYTVPGARDIKFAGDMPRRVKNLPALQVMDIFYLDRSNAMSSARFEKLRERYPHIQKVRYVNSVMDTIKRCANRTKQNSFWVIGSHNIYDDFDFAWHPQPWQKHMTHVFGTQWNKWSDTFLINRSEFERHSRWARGIEEFPNLNFVQDQAVVTPSDLIPVYVVEHDNQYHKEVIDDRCRVVRKTRYFDSYLNTLRRIITDAAEEHLWVVSSLCDYSQFDFSWQPEVWQRDMLHVFATGDQKFGDTFYVPIKALRSCIDELELLEYFDTVNFRTDQKVSRLDMPLVINKTDSQVDAVVAAEFSGPLAVFAPRQIQQSLLPTVSLWREQTKTIIPLDPGAEICIVPKAAMPYIRTQLYDYPYIDRAHKHQFTNQPLDIIFISNGEPQADRLWEHLEKSLTDSKTTNRLHRVDGVNGRVAAYQAAATQSQTAWFFAVFAKLQVNEDFDWSWQPDRMQQPKHYIFHAYNPVNHLVYGHQAMIAYNVSMTLANRGEGLDFTLDQPHEVVPIVSGTAYYDNEPWTCWRTAFREALKLRHSFPDVENDYRLQRWLSVGEGINGHWSTTGANDAVKYYESVGGDFDEIKKSYEWAWLASYATMIHPELVTQSRT